jgi:hypothetical protein
LKVVKVKLWDPALGPLLPSGTARQGTKRIVHVLNDCITWAMQSLVFEASIHRMMQTNSNTGSTHVTEEPAPMANHELRGASLNSAPSLFSQMRYP